MKKPIIAIVLYILIFAGSLLYAYNSDDSVFGHERRLEEQKETSSPEYSRNEPKPKLPEVEYECDFKNKIDSTEYFSDKGVIKYPDDEDEYLVSHNAFDTSDGGRTIVDITSSDYEAGVFTGKMIYHIKSDIGGVVTPCAYDSVARSPLHYTYIDHFSLLLDDYNNDGNPDFTLRTGDLKNDGGYYYIEYSTNESYPCYHMDSAVFVYGRFEDSIRLDHTDMDHFFFLTLDGNNEPVPYMYSSQFHKADIDEFSVGGRLYSAFYENGVLTVKATDCKKGMEMYKDEVPVIIRKYDDRMWSRCGEFSAVFTADGEMISKYEHELRLEKGLYQLEFALPDGVAYAEFTVRTQ